MTATIEIDLTFKCSSCKRELEINQVGGSEEVRRVLWVTPCTNCLNDARSDGYAEGNSDGDQEGYDRGHEDGYNEAKEEKE
jgi:hypothetical protein